MPLTTEIHILLQSSHNPRAPSLIPPTSVTADLQLTSELEELQQQLFQQKQQVLALTAQNSSMQAELESSCSRLQGEAERAAFHQQQLDAERKLRKQSSEEVRWAGLCCAVLCCAVLCCAVLCCAVLCCAVLSSELIESSNCLVCWSKH